jgi:hypothetical protein
MAAKLISELPAGPYREILLEAAKFGKTVLPDADVDLCVTFGLAAKIAELEKKVLLLNNPLKMFNPNDQNTLYTGE